MCSSDLSNRLREVAQTIGVEAYMVDSADDLKPEWLAGKRRVGVTAGASAPEVLVDEIIEAFRARFEVTVEEVVTAEERIAFNVPRELRDAIPA